MTQHMIARMACLALVLLCACSPNVVVNYDKNTDFSGYHTYTWGKGKPAQNPILDRQIVETIDEQLAQKEFSKTDDNPDLVVTYHAATEEQTDYGESSYVSGYGPAYGSPAGTSSEVPMTVKVGTIVVDMFDTRAKRNVWRGVGSDIVADDPEKTSVEIRRGAAKMFENFPPRRGETGR